MVFRSRILICFQKPQDLLQKSDDNEDDDDDYEKDIADGFWKQNANLLPKTITSAVKNNDFASKVHDSSLWQSDQEIFLKSLK